MAGYLKRSELSAELAALDALLHSLPPNDTLGKMSLQSRREEIAGELAALAEQLSETLASTALYFSGRPVIGSLGIEADFAANAIADYKDLIVKVWATTDADVRSRGPVPDQDSARLHVTELLHGSIGFLIEEVDVRAVPLFPSPLKKAADQAAALIAEIATESEEQFQSRLENMNQRLFSSIQRFFKDMHRSEAAVRIVDANRDATLTRDAVDAAYVRLESADVEESESEEEGLLVGLIPYGARFEFRRTGGALIKGKVAATLSEAYLERLRTEQAIGRWWRAKLLRREVRRFGRISENYTLLDLQEASQRGEDESASGPSEKA